MSATNVSDRRRPARHSTDVKTIAEARREFARNEHYWHGITNTIGDRALGTFPDHRDVSRSKTARSLDPEAAG